MSNYGKVKDFMTTFGQEVKSDAGWAGDDIADLRIELIAEELQELCEAVEPIDVFEPEVVIEVADALPTAVLASPLVKASKAAIPTPVF